MVVRECVQATLVWATRRGGREGGDCVTGGISPRCTPASSIGTTPQGQRRHFPPLPSSGKKTACPSRHPHEGKVARRQPGLAPNARPSSSRWALQRPALLSGAARARPAFHCLCFHPEIVATKAQTAHFFSMLLWTDCPRAHQAPKQPGKIATHQTTRSYLMEAAPPVVRLCRVWAAHAIAPEAVAIMATVTGLPPAHSPRGPRHDGCMPPFTRTPRPAHASPTELLAGMETFVPQAR